MQNLPCLRILSGASSCVISRKLDISLATSSKQNKQTPLLSLSLESNVGGGRNKEVK